MTLIEVVVALAILSVMSVLAWRGYAQLRLAQGQIDQLLDQHQRLDAAMTQWSQDLAALQAMTDRPSLAFDGQRLSLVRRSATGLQVVHWSVTQDASGVKQLTRQSWPPTTDPETLDAAWRSPERANEFTVRLFAVQDWQLRYYRDNSWSHPLSSGDLRADSAPPGPGTPPPTPATRTLWPRAIRLVLSLPTAAQGEPRTLQRDVILPPDEP